MLEDIVCEKQPLHQNHEVYISSNGNHYLSGIT